MRFICTYVTVSSVLLATSLSHADPVVFIKNNSNRAVHIVPIGSNGTDLAGAQFVKPNGEYKEGNVNAHDVKGVNIKYCANNISCTTTDQVRVNGTTAHFKFADQNATKYYLKLDITKDDTISLTPQKGNLLGRTSNLKWSLDGNIMPATVVGPTFVIEETAKNMPSPFSPPSPRTVPVQPKTTQPTSVAPRTSITPQKPQKSPASDLEQ